MVRAVRRPSGVVNGGVRPSLHTALLTRFRVKGARVRFRACVQEHPRPKTSGTGRSATTRGKGTEKTADGQTFRRYRRVWAHFFGLKCIFAGKIHFWAKRGRGKTLRPPPPWFASLLAADVCGDVADGLRGVLGFLAPHAQLLPIHSVLCPAQDPDGLVRVEDLLVGVCLPQSVEA